MSKEQIVQATDAWAAAFNAGDAAGCASHYQPDATMHAEPFDPIQGKEGIQAFWQQLIDGGYTDVRYLDRTIEMVDEDTAILSSPWAMNQASGVIVREEWKRGDDGRWLLVSDHFQILENNPS